MTPMVFMIVRDPDGVVIAEEPVALVGGILNLYPGKTVATIEIRPSTPAKHLGCPALYVPGLGWVEGRTALRGATPEQVGAAPCVLPLDHEQGHAPILPAPVAPAGTCPACGAQSVGGVTDHEPWCLVAPDAHPCSGGRCPDPAAHAEGAHDL